MSTILLVEYDPLEARLMLPLLEREFGEVRRATDAAEALSAIEQPDFAGRLSLVISGQSMNGIKKADFIAELRDRVPAVPVLVLGRADESAGDYPGENVTYLPRPMATRQVITAASQLLARENHHVA